MGRALVQAALLMGAEVTVVSGLVSVAYPAQARIVNVLSADEMLSASLTAVEGADLFIGAAAVADYRPAERVKGKLRRSDSNLTLELVPNPDVVAEVARTKKVAKVVAFAAEPDSDLATARAKMERKGVAAIAVNDVSEPGAGFEVDTNRLRLLTVDGQEFDSGSMSKLGCALWLLERLA
jgi:phosphopantothenoylcysteine decarboxylase/phosphopantothenate--cysteine ligase